MFNNYNAGDTNIKLTACSGGIYKTYKESWFKRFNLNSVLADKLFRKENCFYNKRTNKFGTAICYVNESSIYTNDKDDIDEIIVLQMILCGDMEVIAELINKKDFEKYFNKEISENNERN